jgi:hypothetical protein
MIDKPPPLAGVFINNKKSSNAILRLCLRISLRKAEKLPLSSNLFLYFFLPPRVTRSNASVSGLELVGFRKRKI